MADWREQILREFTPQVARLTLVADPDGLLIEEGVLQEIRLNSLPYDLLQAGRRLSFNLGELFPNLSYPVVSALDGADLDALYRAQTQHNPGKQSDNATKDFALRHVFEIAPELIRQPSDLLRVLLRRHYRGQRIPTILDERFVEVLRQNGLFGDWPLETIIPDRDAFFAFLQERWPVFLDRLATQDKGAMREDKTYYDLAFPGPVELPFDHDDVRVYIDNLFLEGLLQSVSHEQSHALGGKWAAIGIRIDPEADRLQRAEGLIRSMGTTVPGSDAKHQDWLLFAYRWAELTALWMEGGAALPAATKQRVQELRAKVETAFLDWIQNRYAGLHNQPALPPVMLHHIPRAMARRLDDSRNGKAALVVVDGLSLDQWIVIRAVLHEQCSRMRIHEEAVFAWVPTITSVSRQAVFAGKPPLYFPSSIQSTDKEAAHWTQFWVDQGLSQYGVAYEKGLGDGSLKAVEEILSHPKVRVVGLIIDKVDKIMHGMELGTAGMHNQVRQWAKQGFMASLLELLLRRDFCIYLTSDHGNIEAKGCGRPAEGAVADVRGERVRVYPDKLLRSQVKERFPAAIEWPPFGLPEDYLPLLAPGCSAFIREGDQIVGHGGISIEELVVPLVQIERRIS
jgi:hypothetical protein